MSKTVILSSARTPIGKLGGACRALTRPLGRTAISAALERAEVAREQVEHVVMGQVLQAGQGQIPSRQAQIKARDPHGGFVGDDQQGLRLGFAGGGDARCLDPRGRSAGRRCRWHGVDVQGPLSVEGRSVWLSDG